MVIEPSEPEVVLRAFRDFANGTAIKSFVKQLSAEEIRGRRKRKFLKPKTEWHVTENESLRIVPQELWERVAARWKEVDRAWPQRSAKTAAGRQRSYVEANPPHLLSGALRCGKCGNTIGQVSGKGTGYYGCLAAVRAARDNKLLVSRRTAERAVLSAVQERFSNPGRDPLRPRERGD